MHVLLIYLWGKEEREKEIEGELKVKGDNMNTKGRKSTSRLFTA